MNLRINQHGCIVQVGNYSVDRGRWDRPENMKDKRPVYYVPTKNGVTLSPPGFHASGTVSYQTSCCTI